MQSLVLSDKREQQLDLPFNLPLSFLSCLHLETAWKEDLFAVATGHATYFSVWTGARKHILRVKLAQSRCRRRRE